MGTADEGSGKRGGGCPDLGPDILGGGPVSETIRVGEMVDDPTYWEGFGRISPQGGLQADEESTLARKGRCVDIPLSGGHDCRCGPTGGG